MADVTVSPPLKGRIGERSLSATNKTDHRRFPRRQLSTRVTIRDAIRGRRLSGETVDINPLGMLVLVKRPMRVGEILALSFPVPDDKAIARVSGEVVRVVNVGGGKYRLGVEFFSVDTWLFDDLCEYVYEVPQKRELTLVVDSPRSE